MAANQKLEQLNRKFSVRLDQFESEWLNGTPPDIASCLRDSASASVQDLSDLIELDLEYRWKQFSIVEPDSARDEQEFPLFPLLEDYVALLPEQRREDLLVPQLIAEEYRVRSRWGDQPDKQSFAERFPHHRTALQSALDEIDKDFENEEISPRSEDSSQSMLDHSTLIYSRGSSDIKSDSPIGVTGWTTFGKYQLETPLGRGAFGEVWKAYDPHLKRHVAIKFPRNDRHFPPEMLESFQREAQKLASLGRIPGIVTVFDCGESAGLPYIVSDYIEGESLDTRMKRRSLSHDQSAKLVAEMASALHLAHKKGLVHRDIKPSNILLDADEKPFLADFGLAIQEEDRSREVHSIVGTFAYMSPEQARGESQRVDGRADIYALGVVLYRLLTGRLPFLGQTPEDYVDQLLHQEPRPLRSIDDTIPVALERVCLKCLSKSISGRYTTSGDLASSLRESIDCSLFDRSRWIAFGLAFVFLGILVWLSISGGGRRDRSLQPPGIVRTSPPDWTEPAVITWQPYNDLVDSFGYNTEKKTFDFDTFGPSLFEIEKCSTDVLTLKTTVRIGGNDRIGLVGVFWALGPVVGESRIDTTCWAIQVGRAHQVAPDILEIRQHDIGLSGGRHEAKDWYSVRGIPLRDPLPDRVALEILVTPTQVEQIILNGVKMLEAPVPLVANHGREWRVLKGTGYGIIGEFGHFSVETFSAE